MSSQANDNGNDNDNNTNTELARRLIESYRVHGVHCRAGRQMPSPKEVAGIVEALRELLLPGSTGEPLPARAVHQAHIEGRLGHLRVRLIEQLFRGLHYRCSEHAAECPPCEERAVSITGRFLAELPALRDRVLRDVQAAYDNDPAATGPDEVVFSYPGVRAMTVYRIAHAILLLGALGVPRMMTEQAHADTGIDIHPGARIGESCFIDHGTGVVIGETTIIGDRVRLYQGVTLGALSLPPGTARKKAHQKRHPTIEDDVIIYANATILGGDTVIGRGAVVGGNTWITRSVAPGARITNPCG